MFAQIGEMYVAVDPQGKEINKFTMEGKRSFDDYIAKYREEKILRNNPSLQAEPSLSPRKPKRKKSRVRGLVLLILHC